MLLSQQTYLKVSQKTTPQQLSLAYDCSFVMVCHQKQLDKSKEQEKHSSVILHLDKNSNIIHRYQFKVQAFQCLMLGENLLLVAEVESNILTVIHLRDTSLRTIKYKFDGQKLFLQMMYFHQTDLFCIKQSKKCIWERAYYINIQNQKLTYFSSQQFTGHPLISYQYSNVNNNSNVFPINCCLDVNQVNNHSMVGYYLPELSQIILHDIIVNNNGSKISRVRMVPLPSATQVTQIQPRMWQIEKDQLFYINSKITAKGGIGIVNIKNKFANKWEWKQGTVKSVDKVTFLKDFICIGEIKYHKNQDHDEYNTSYTAWYLIDSSYFNISYTTDYDSQSQAFPTIIYSHSSNDVLVEGRCTKKGDKVKVRKLWPVGLAQIYMQLLLGLNEDLDDDLLMDSIQLLTQ